MENININDEFEEKTEELKQEAVEEAKKQKLEEKKKDKNYLQPEKQKSEKVKEAFDKIEFLSLDSEQKREIAENINTEVELDTLFISEILLSAAIVTLGLIQNSAAVVIGAMLIAPVLRPIHGLGFAIARGGRKIFKNSLKMLGVSIFFSIAISYVGAKIIGLDIQTPEILARTNPNVIDFFIAIFSAMVGILSLRYKRLGAGIAGVAMAVALLPPLCVIGIELAFAQYPAAFGALLLFLSNIIGIVLVSTILFWLYGFTPHAKNLQGKVFIRICIFCASLVCILIPLTLSFQSLKVHHTILEKVEKTISSLISEENGVYKVEKVHIKSETKEVITLQIRLKVGDGVDIKYILPAVKQKLQGQFKKNIELEFEIIPVVVL